MTRRRRGTVAWLSRIAVVCVGGALHLSLPAADDVVDLPALDVGAEGLEPEYWPEEVPNVFPFVRSGFFSDIDADELEMRRELAPLMDQLAALTDFNPVEFSSVSGAGTPRGFTAPRLRNGVNQSGFPEIIIGGRRDLLTGFMATYSGRTAPGGILNHQSRRPAVKPTHEASMRLSTQQGGRSSLERNAPLVQKKLHYRLLVEGSWRKGPQDFADQEAANTMLSLRYAPKKGTVWLIELENAWANATPSGGIPLQRANRQAKRGAPYAPLAEFNTNGPNTYSRRHSRSVSALLEQQLQDDLVLRAGGEVWARDLRELRFDTGAFLLDEGIFDGVREPQFNQRHQNAAGLQLELDGLGRLPFANHRWVLGAFGSREDSDRDQRALSRSVRDSLPAAVRFFDPKAPDYSIPGYTPDVYSRVLTDREDGADYYGVFLTERVALARNRVYATFGARNDWVRSEVNDRRANAAIPRAEAQGDRATYHFGLVWHAVPNRLAGFFNHSTAFQPQRRVDARTGRIIGNEGTSGVEGGLRYASSDARLTATWNVYRLWNEGITRTNPLYNDPLHDPDRRQPQFVSSGEEQFTGSEIAVRRRVTSQITASGKVAWLEAITTSSPDLPEEVGRQLSRVPRLTGSGSLRYRFETPKLKGLDVGGNYSWIGEHVAIYETEKREELHYGSYGVVSFSANFGWEAKKRRHAVSLSIANVLDKDLFAAAGRVGGERSLDAGYSVRF